MIAPGDPNKIRPETPTIAEFFKKDGYQTYFSGKWHLGDTIDAMPVNHGFDTMKDFLAYYSGVYAYTDLTSASGFSARQSAIHGGVLEQGE